MRSLFKAGTLALTTLVAAGAFVGCSSDSDKKQSTDSVGGQKEGPVGGIGLNLQPVPGITINQVHYAVTGGTAPGGGAVPTIEGDLPTPGTADNFSFGVPLPVATGYTLSLTAESAEAGDDITCTGGFTPFNITPNNATQIAITLTCVDNTNGTVIGVVDVETDACPTLKVNYAVATPYSANVGSSLEVLSNATDTNPALPITYQWAVAGNIGTFATPTAANSTFTCNSAGQNVLATVTASNGACTKSLSTVVSCNNVLCGNGVNDPGEACDNSATPNPLCLPNCTLANCGNGSVEAPIEQCDPPVAGLCSATCQNIPIVCGDGFVQPGEECDPPAPGVCSATCQNVAAAVCGNGTTEAGEVCDVASPGTNYSVANCGGIWNATLTPPGGSADACGPIESAACQACVAAAPACSTLFCESPDISGNAAGGPAAGQPKANLCRELLDCIYDTNCAASGNTVDCYCGTAGDCATGANGACRAEVEAAAEATDFVTIGGRFGDETYAVGKATGRIDCESAFACSGTCGVN